MATAQLGTLLRYVQKLAAGNGSLERTDRQLLDDFSARRDEAAFAALVARHGSMVLRVCRRVLNHEQDAEDAFQATFLILARKSASIRKPEALAEWLHGVAYWSAREVRRSAARRRRHEARLWTLMRRAAVSPTWDDVQAVLDEEIRRLREPFRATFVVCVLEGKSAAEAAAELGVRQGTVSSRLTRARQLLQQRLVRRGIKLSGLLAALSVADSAAQAGLPAVLAKVTVRFGLLVAAGETAAGVIPSHIAALAAGVTRAMFLTKTKIAVALLFAVGLVATGASLLTCQALAAKETPPAAQKAEPPAKAEAKPRTAGTADAVKDKGDTIAVSGRVLDPDGKPFAGAKVYLTRACGYVERPDPSLAKMYAKFYATTAADGSFTLTVPKVPPFPDEAIDIAATAKDFGVAFVTTSRDGDNKNVTLQLVKDDVPIKGQIVDLQGKPVQGATIRVLRIAAAAKEDLGPWLEAVKAKKGLSGQLEGRYFTQGLASAEVPALAHQVTTDAAGRFRLTGIGRDRLAIVRLEGPAIATEQLRILTRVEKTIAVPTEAEVIYAEPAYNLPTADYYYHGASFRHVAEATTPIVGTVRDRDTNKPLAGVTIRSLKLAHKPRKTYDFVQTTSDEQGRYRLTGMPKGEGNQILLVPRDDQPYLKVPVDVPEGVGLDPVTVDIQVKRGVLIEGKVTDNATGKPVPTPPGHRRGTVAYSALANNPYWRIHYPEIQYFGPVKEIREDGTFRIVGLPGPGVLVVTTSDQYLATPQRDDADGGPKEGEELDAIPGLIQWHIYNAVARIDPPKEAEKVTRDIKLDPGETFNGTLVGPDGKPVSEASSCGMSNWFSSVGVEKGSFTVRAINPRRPRPVLFHNAEKRLVGALELPKHKSQPVTVKLQPGATATGRLVGADGQPRANVQLQLMWRPVGGTRRFVGLDLSYSYFTSEIKTDQQGRFRIDTLLPGLEYGLNAPGFSYGFGEGLRSGETKDLGDVKESK
jgi:RNA polymerase sigma factor (sigma-70 family)